MKKLVFWLALAAGVLAGCGTSDMPPGAGFGVSVTLIQAEGKYPAPNHNQRRYVLNSGGKCRIMVRHRLQLEADDWIDEGEVFCDAPLSTVRP